MRNVTRREFLKLGGMIAAGAGLAAADAGALAAGLEKLAGGAVRVVWLEAQSCSGCSVSLLNSKQPGPLELLTDTISLVFHQTLGAAQGSVCAEVLEKAADAGDYILVVEGAIPAAMPEACTLDDRPISEWIDRLLPGAKAVVAVGTCAAFGGIPAAEGNPTGAVGVADYISSRGRDPKGLVLNCPSCPAHPMSMVGTLAYVASRGYPKVHPELLTPDMFYGQSTHDNCPRFHDYNKHVFATNFGDDVGCLFKLGCLGPLTYTACPQRQWNGGVNWCVRAGAPCIGCSSPDFVKKRDFPLYRHREEDQPVDLADLAPTGGAS